MWRSLAILIVLPILAVSSVRAVPPSPAAGAPPAANATSIDRGFQRLDNFDSPGAFTALDDAARTEPDNALVDSVRAVTYLCSEMARQILTQFRR